MKDSIRKLREMTGCGIIDCKNALQETDGDLDKAVAVLKERGASILKKKVGRKAEEGAIEAYVHFSQNLGAMVEVNCETDFVARSPDFKKFVKDLATHIAALGPEYISKEDIPPEELNKVKESQRKEYFKENCLLEQPYVKDNSITVADYLKTLVAKFRENIIIKKFVRFCLGE